MYHRVDKECQILKIGISYSKNGGAERKGGSVFVNQPHPPFSSEVGLNPSEGVYVGLQCSVNSIFNSWIRHVVLGKQAVL